MRLPALSPSRNLSERLILSVVAHCEHAGLRPSSSVGGGGVPPRRRSREGAVRPVVSIVSGINVDGASGA
jgi:hypothetical protein